MVIEDDPDILSIVEYVLAEYGYEVIPVGNQPVIADVEQARPDLILLDEWLQGMRGSNFCRQLKSNTQTAAIPVLIISAVFPIEDIVKEACADGYIRKPFDIDNMNNTISSFLNKDQ